MTGSQPVTGTPEAVVVLPTFNEAENLQDVVARILAAAPRVAVLVVDDASPDGTGALADRLAAADPRVVVLHRKGARGLGMAIAAGMQEALRRGAAVAITMDCDLSHDPAEIPRLLAAGGDVAIGSRYVAGGRLPNWSVHRKLLSAAANLLVRLLFRLPARDCTSGYRAYRADTLARVPFDRLHSTGYSFEVEILFWVARLGSRGLREIPITFLDRSRGTSKMGAREAVAGLLNLLRLRLSLRG
jgi:dolichol-phosphate mannosyltransferase